MGWDRGWKQRNAIPSSLPLPLFLLTFPSLSDVAPRSTIWTPGTGYNGACAWAQGRDFLVYNGEHQVPVCIPFSSVLRHSTALCSLLTSCFKRHLTGLHGVTMYRQYTVTCRVLQVWIKHNFILIPRHWFPSTECGQSVKMNTGVREPSRPRNLVPSSPTAKGKKQSEIWVRD